MPNEQKFKRGQTVTILSRRTPEDPSCWENCHLGNRAIIEFSNVEARIIKPGLGQRDVIAYSLYLLHDDNPGLDYSTSWFEQKFLELYCSNEERGKKIIDSSPNSRKIKGA